MKIAIPSEGNEWNSPVCRSFGRTPFFIVADTDTLGLQVIDNEAAAAQGGAGIKAAQAVADSGAQAVVEYQDSAAGHAIRKIWKNVTKMLLS